MAGHKTTTRYVIDHSVSHVKYRCYVNNKSTVQCKYTHSNRVVEVKFDLP